MSLRARELSARGRGGLSVLALEGPGALARARELVAAMALEPGTLRLGRLRLGLLEADEVLVCALTTERVELHLHGSPALVRELRAALAARAAAAPARTEADLASELLPRAPSEAGARILLDQAEGALALELTRLAQVSDAELERDLTRLSQRSRTARWALEPATVVLAGPVNAGKSTLFNALLGARRASVSDEAGTTRDALVERALIGRYPVELVDTAGERALPGSEPAQEVELAAQSISRDWTRRADLVLWLQAPGSPEPALRSVRVEVLHSLADLAPQRQPPSGPAITARDDPAGACARVVEVFQRVFELPPDPWEPGRGVVLGVQGQIRLRTCLASASVRRRAELQQWLTLEHRQR